MGLIYSKINLYNESENCYEKALGLEPDNESYKKNLEVKYPDHPRTDQEQGL